MSVYVTKYCLFSGCEWTATADAGPSGRMMGMNSAGNEVEDAFDAHYREVHKAKMDAKYEEQRQKWAASKP